MVSRAHVGELNRVAARLARESADAASQPDRPRWVAGVLGPTNRTASISPDVNDPAFRNVCFDTLREAYAEAIDGLVEGGVDLLLVETVFDTLNAKAALFAIDEYLEAHELHLPVIVSGTITDLSGRTLSGQTVEAFWNSVRHAKPLAISLNCALGAKELRAHVADLARVADTYVGCWPNAGLPNELGGYDETPEQMAESLGEFASSGLLNLVGGCCGTTPEHIRAIADAVRETRAARVPTLPARCRLSGLEAMTIGPDTLFVNIGERTNVTGSARFAKLILDEDFDTAIAVARDQVENGAQIIDINMDEGMLDSEAAMQRYLEPHRGRARREPRADHDRFIQMVGDRSGAKVRARQRLCQLDQLEGGRSRVSGPGEKDQTLWRRCRGHGLRRAGSGGVHRAQVQGLRARLQAAQGTGRVCGGGHRFRPQYICRGHGYRRAQPVRACVYRSTRRIKQSMPEVKVSGGVSNLSFSFRGNNTVREAMHAGFLYHCHKGGAGYGHRQCRAASGLRGHRARPARAHRGRFVRPQSGCDRPAARACAIGKR